MALQSNRLMAFVNCLVGLLTLLQLQATTAIKQHIPFNAEKHEVDQKIEDAKKNRQVPVLSLLGGKQELQLLSNDDFVVALDLDNKDTMMLVQVNSSWSFSDPCDNIQCGNVICPTGFSVKRVKGHCCSYCINPDVQATEVIKGPLGTNGGKKSTVDSEACKGAWCFPTMCAKDLEDPKNGGCCKRCPAE
eukprot:TRINITY_DN2087_c0_g1_i1.p1 TRINITY_DN2087_c0_g1~~TRINITY_DN2087_c0_g1_i1.p1  ORF type:complete len:190 (+),score=37.24 TRINITY_DN2087_c0_g1_i1:101-670(+)